MERLQFTFYSSFFRAISRIRSKSARCDAYDALCRYALFGEAPNVDSMPEPAAIAFEVILPNLTASRRKAESGSTGGKRKQTESKKEANDKQTESKDKDKNKNKNKIKDKCQKAEAFEAFWNAYPRKEGKQKAVDAFEKVDVEIEVLLSSLERQKSSAQWTKDGGQFIPHPATWLNGRRWEDQTVSVHEPEKRQLDDDEVAAIRRMMEGQP